MFFLNHLYGTVGHWINIDADEIDAFYPAVTYDQRDCLPEFQEFANIVIL